MSREAGIVFRIAADMRQWESALKRTEKGALSMRNRVGQIFNRATSRLSGMIANPLTAVLGGAAVLKATHDLVQFDSALTRVRINGNMTADQQMALRKQIVDTSIATGQSREELLAFFKAMPEDMAIAPQMLKEVATVATATGASMADLGELVDSLGEKFMVAPNQMGEALSILAAQGKLAGFTLDKMAGTSGRLFAAAQRFGTSGIQGVREFGAVLQLASKSGGGGERGMMAVEGLFNEIVDKADKLQQGGVTVFRPGSKTELRSIGEILKSIIRTTKGDVTTLSRAFSGSSIRVLTELIREYKTSGGFKLFDDLAQSGNSSDVMKDFAIATQDAGQQFKTLMAVGTTFANSALEPVIQQLAESMREITADPEKLERVKEWFRQFGADLAEIGKVIGPTAGLIARLFEGMRFAYGYATGKGQYGDEPFVNLQEKQKAFSTETLFATLPADEQDRIGKRGDFWKGAQWDREVYAEATRQKIISQNQINLTVNVDGTGRTTAVSDDMNTTVNAGANRGSLKFAGALDYGQ